MLDQLLGNDLFSLLLVFVRIGAALMLMPGFGENYVPARVRLAISGGLALVVAPLVVPLLPPRPEGLMALFAILFGEIVIGLFLGAMTRMLLIALHIAGVVVGFQSSLGNATFFDPSTAQQGSAIGSFFQIIGVFVIFAADLHYLMLAALVDSYELFPPTGPLPIADMSAISVRFMAQSFALGIKIAAPFLVVAMVFYIGLGLLARLMPQVQVFFIAIPLQITLSFTVMILTLSAGMMWFLKDFETALGGFVARG